jgi:hypothetical protein
VLLGESGDRDPCITPNPSIAPAPPHRGACLRVDVGGHLADNVVSATQLFPLLVYLAEEPGTGTRGILLSRPKMEFFHFMLPLLAGIACSQQIPFFPLYTLRHPVSSGVVHGLLLAGTTSILVGHSLIASEFLQPELFVPGLSYELLPWLRRPVLLASRC